MLAMRGARAEAVTHGALRVGVASADITPPIGASTFGHGLEARATEGTWTRLHCRAFVLALEGGSPLALVPCDLPATSTLLHRRVAAALADVPGLDATRIVVTATHTHAGPAHYFEGVDYGGALSTRLPGYDEHMTEFLANSIAKAIRTAMQSMVPASMAWHEKDALWGLARNRNLAPHRENDAADLFPWAASAPPGLDDDLRAIDPRVSVLGFADADGCALGALSFYAVHPTVLPHTNRLWGGDTHAVTSRVLEQRMRAANAAIPACRDKAIRPAGGIVNTNEGDVIAIFSRGTIDEAEMVGRKLADQVWATYRSPPEPAPSHATDLAVRYLELSLAGAPLLDGQRLDPRASIGLGAPSGSREHPTVFSAVSPEIFYEGHRSDGPDPKAPVGGFIQRIVGGGYAYPEHVPLTVVRLGDRLIAFVPAELTVGAGHELVRKVRAEAAARGGGIRDVLVGGLADGYIQYVTTKREYALQGYEAASDLYGVNTASLLAERAALLARSALGGSVDCEMAELRARSGTFSGIGEVAAFRYDTGPSRARFDTGEGDAPLASIHREPIGLCRLPHGEAPLVCFRWWDGGPGRVAARGGLGPWVRLVTDAGVAVTLPEDGEGDVCAGETVTRGPCTAVDDDSTAFVVREHEHGPGDRHRWSATYRPSAAAWRAITARGGTYRIEAPAQGLSPVLSPSFWAASLPPECTPHERDECAIAE
jgi:neutral ceramidase